MRDFLHRIETLEDSARNAGYTTSEIITVLRKVYFDDAAGQLNYAGSAISGGTWQALIPNASIVAPVHWASLGAEREFLLLNRVVTVEGAAVDMAHVFCGLDARNHPASVSLAHGIQLASNMHALTFLGDLGRVVVEYLHHLENLQEALHTGTSEFAAFYDKCLPNGASMAGNADAFAIQFLPEDTVFSALTRYYLKGGYTARYNQLRQVVHAGHNDTQRKLTQEVLAAAMAYAAAKPAYLQDVIHINTQAGVGSRSMLSHAPEQCSGIAEAYYTVAGWVSKLFLKRISSRAF